MSDSPEDEFDDDPTHVDPSLAQTTPHRSLDWLGGRESGFSAGVELVLAALGEQLRKAGTPEPEISWRLSRIREEALRRG